MGRKRTESSRARRRDGWGVVLFACSQVLDLRVLQSPRSRTPTPAGPPYSRMCNAGLRVRLRHAPVFRDSLEALN